jgi:tRNA-specific 2-thiouridylase
MKVIVGLSGGVDSAVAAHLLIEQDYQVEGLFMKNWDEDDGTEYCTAKEDLADAQRVADHLGIKLHTANFAAEYWDNVFEYFLKEYVACRTPNPDILCNREIKFKVFLDYAKQLGADKIATGHYARRLNPKKLHPELTPYWSDQGPETGLFQGKDPNKDQSYFLHALTTAQLSQSLFPLGDLAKPEVRARARDLGLHNHNRKDSTGICFIGERRFQEFLARYCPKNPGPIKTLDGTIIAEHDGLSYYTIGQRQGLGIGGQKKYSDEPWFVVEKQPQTNTLVVAQGSNHPALFAPTLVTETPHWIHPILIPGTSKSLGTQHTHAANRSVIRCEAKIRYRQDSQSCHISLQDPQNPEAGLKVRFDKPQRAVTPGQFAVFYHNQYCLGGAQIAAAYQDDG